MKNENKKAQGLEQKIYAALIGFGVFALAAVTIIYGVRTQKTNDLAQQKIQNGEQNPVTGPVAKTKTENTEEKKENGQEKEKQPSDSNTETLKEEAKAKSAGAGYDGKEKLSWPVTGNVIIPYSMDTTVYFETLDQYQCNPALYVKADKGTEVKASYGGTVSAITKNERYGNLITIDMGNGYKISYGQLTDIPFKKGDQVKTGDIIGKIGDPTDYFTLEGSHLYMKMTLKGKPVNPAEYLEP